MTRAEAERRAGLPAFAPIIAVEPGLDSRAVMRLICDTMGITLASLMGPSRNQELTAARKCVCFVLRSKGLSASAIGRRLGLNHSTVISHCETFDDAAQKRPELRIVADAFSLARPMADIKADLQSEAGRVSGLINARLTAATLRKRQQNIAAAARSLARKKADQAQERAAA
ncbi:hypothetical protein J2792_002366 [Novosphingobium capsulatum]|uniref:Chromosomal replication initiator DnaA C-terminal domain-containing protein n=1 Tax=Novosphingobium capsulatum TaxID=13688 RepID=A0ABU1MMD8_9SPHN|nr:helix-turn-helix domain-containing protein [Novosphingobium capsulatum]MDR6511494.1 hypothetical protein [Novosphingobium capsulatum]